MGDLPRKVRNTSIRKITGLLDAVESGAGLDIYSSIRRPPTHWSDDIRRIVTNWIGT